MNKGSCLCGDVTWQVEGTPQMMMNCHCSICRKIHGSDFATFVTYPGDSFEWLSGEEKVQHYASTPGAPAMRAFCPRCGSVVAALSPGGSSAFMPAGNLEGDIDKSPEFHCFVGSKAPWCEIADDAPQYEAYPEGYDAPGIDSPARPPATEGAIGGSCHCGKVRFEFDKPFERMGYCHCSLCRKSMSSVMSSEIFVDKDDFRWIQGKDNLTGYVVPGTHFALQFCRDCSSLAPLYLGEEENLFLTPAGSLDQDPGLRPMGHIFVGSKANWDDITDDLPRFEEYPPGVG